MQVQIVKWGNGQGIRIPKTMMKEAGMNLNEVLDISLIENKIIISKTFQPQSLEQRAAKFGGKLGPYHEYDWGESVGKEIW
ncbi:MAG: AbrB/MazE/SpoVT family DNA-binding domain-containing protein [Eubacterium sp.]|nr:AbrB/MazE/SpoVT family DNA-binding domain-containing protein [Eubacterium sp.]